MRAHPFYALAVLFAATGCGPHIAAEPSFDPLALEKQFAPEVRRRPIEQSAAADAWPEAKRAITAFDESGGAQWVMGSEGSLDPRQALALFTPASPSLHLMTAAAKGAYWEAPLGDDDNWTRAKSVSKALIVRGRYRLQCNDVAGGVADLLAARSIGLRMLGGRGTMVQTLTGVSALALADHAIRKLVIDPKISPKAFELLLANMPKAPDVDVAMQDAVRTDLYEDFITKLAASPDPYLHPEVLESLGAWGAEPLVAAVQDSARPFDRRESALLAARGCAIVIRDLGKPRGEAEPLTAFTEELIAGWPKDILVDRHLTSAAQIEAARGALGKQSNPLGKLIVANLLPEFWQFADSSMLWRTEQEATRALLALRIWSDRHDGALPASLKLLVDARILAWLPHDFYGDSALRYDPRTGRVWSVGSDGVDGGGQCAPELSSERDLVWLAKR